MTDNKKFFIVGLLFLPLVLVICAALSMVVLYYTNDSAQFLSSFVIFLAIFNSLFAFHIAKRYSTKQFFLWLFGCSVGAIMGSLLMAVLYVVIQRTFFGFKTVDYPDQEELIARLQQHHNDYGKYPEHLKEIGYGAIQIERDSNDVGLTYWSDHDDFEVCYVYWSPDGTRDKCYDSKIKKWELIKYQVQQMIPKK